MTLHFFQVQMKNRCLCRAPSRYELYRFRET